MPGNRSSYKTNWQKHNQKNRPLCSHMISLQCTVHVTLQVFYSILTLKKRNICLCLICCWTWSVITVSLCTLYLQWLWEIQQPYAGKFLRMLSTFRDSLVSNLSSSRKKSILFKSLKQNDLIYSDFTATDTEGTLLPFAGTGSLC